MPRPRVRELHEDDLDGVVRVWEESRTPGRRAVHGLAEVLGAARNGGVGVVAAVGEIVVGAAAASVVGDRAWIVMLALAGRLARDAAWAARCSRSSRSGSMARGVHRMSALLDEDETGATAFRNSGYETRDLTYFERVVPLQPQEVGLLGDLGGRMLPARPVGHAGRHGAREGPHRAPRRPAARQPRSGRSLRGQAAACDRALRPARHRQDHLRQGRRLPAGLAVRGGVPLPAGRRGDGLAHALRETFTEIDELEHAVVFIDEVEEIAVRARRQATGAVPGRHERAAQAHSRASASATAGCSSARRTSSARSTRRSCGTGASTTSSRSARPTAPPGRRSGGATSRRACSSASTSPRSSRRASCSRPADIEFAARKGSQRALETAVFEDAARTTADGPTTEDYQAALRRRARR